MMSGKERREEILQRITNSKTPVSGAALAKSCEVSRQVIVQDIALIRAAGYDVIATKPRLHLQQPGERDAGL